MQKALANKRGSKDDDFDKTHDNFDKLQHEMERLSLDLHGKKFIMNQNGQPVTIIPIKNDRLPPFKVPLATHISNNSSIVEEKEKIVKFSRKNPKMLRVAGSRNIIEEDLLFQPSLTLSANLSNSNESLKVLLPGVKLTTNDIVREGPPLPDDPNKLSRASYESLLQSNTNINSGSTISLSNMNNSSINTNNNTNINKNNKSITSLKDNFDMNVSPKIGFSDEDHDLMTSSISNYLPNSMIKLQLPDINILEGSRIKEIISTNPANNNDYNEYGPKDTIGNVPYSKLPGKPTMHQITNTRQLTDHNSRPKDRDYLINMKSPNEKHHLPPPLIPGQITGHGLNLMNQNSTIISYNNNINSNNNNNSSAHNIRQTEASIQGSRIKFSQTTGNVSIKSKPMSGIIKINKYTDL